MKTLFLLLVVLFTCSEAFAYDLRSGVDLLLETLDSPLEQEKQCELQNPENKNEAEACVDLFKYACTKKYHSDGTELDQDRRINFQQNMKLAKEEEVEPFEADLMAWAENTDQKNWEQVNGPPREGMSVCN